MSNGWLSLSSLYTTYIAVSRTWRSAESSVNVWLHACMLPKQKSNWFSCLRCPRTNSILVILSTTRAVDSTMKILRANLRETVSAKRQKLVAKHNSNRTRQHSTCFVTSLTCRWCCQMQPVWRSGSGRLKTFFQIYENDLPYGILTVIYHAIWSYPESRFFFDKLVGSCQASQSCLLSWTVILLILLSCLVCSMQPFPWHALWLGLGHRHVLWVTHTTYSIHIVDLWVII
jgi:hypothetical protein